MKFGLASLCFHYAVLLSLVFLLLHQHVTEAVVLSTREELQGNATDVLLVGVLSVDTKIQSRTGNPCVTDYTIKARVITVNATSIDSSQGDIVTFGSFDVDNEAFGCLGLAMGPLPPLQLEPGWCGYVYLQQKAPHHSHSSNNNMAENHRSHNSHVEELAIAAHGHSFVAAPDSEECKRHSELIHVLALELEEEDDITSPSLIDVDAHEEDEQEVNNNPQSGSCLANDSNPALIAVLAASLGGTASMITLLF